MQESGQDLEVGLQQPADFTSEIAIRGGGLEDEHGREEEHPSTTQESAATNTLFQRKKRKKTSKVWEEFVQIELPNGVKKLQCVHCKMKLFVQKTGVTTHMDRHLKNACTVRALKLKNQSMLNLQPQDSKMEAPIWFSGKYDHAKQREATAHWVLMHEKPFNIVEEYGYNFMMQVNQPEFTKISRTQVKLDCISVYEEEKKKLKILLRSVG